MRAVVQRVDGASVVVDGETVGAIEGEGLCVLVGVTHEDTKEKAAQLARKLWSIRMLKDERSCSDVGAPLLVISQFTLYGDASKGRRPSFVDAAPPEVGERLYEAYCEALDVPVARGVFGAHMVIDMTADGPVTLTLRRESG